MMGAVLDLNLSKKQHVWDYDFVIDQQENIQKLLNNSISSISTLEHVSLVNPEETENITEVLSDCFILNDVPLHVKKDSVTRQWVLYYNAVRPHSLLTIKHKRYSQFKNYDLKSLFYIGTFYGLSVLWGTKNTDEA